MVVVMVVMVVVVAMVATVCQQQLLLRQQLLRLAWSARVPTRRSRRLAAIAPRANPLWLRRLRHRGLMRTPPRQS